MSTSMLTGIMTIVIPFTSAISIMMTLPNYEHGHAHRNHDKVIPIRSAISIMMIMITLIT